MTREVGEKKSEKITTFLRREKKRFFHAGETLKLRFFSSKTPRYVYGKYVPTLNRPEKLAGENIETIHFVFSPKTTRQDKTRLREIRPDF